MIKLNVWQAISLTGIIMGGAAQAGLHFLDRDINAFWLVYPTWATVFVVGTGLRWYQLRAEETQQ